MAGGFAGVFRHGVHQRRPWGMMLSAVEESPDRFEGAEDAYGRHAAPGAKNASKNSDPDRDMGSALRSIYQRTVEEQVPDEMLSLLSKLD